jgi:hypothetical protein
LKELFAAGRAVTAMPKYLFYWKTVPFPRPIRRYLAEREIFDLVLLSPPVFFIPQKAQALYLFSFPIFAIREICPRRSAPDGWNNLARHNLTAPATPDSALAEIRAGEDYRKIKVWNHDQELAAVARGCVVAIGTVAYAKLR